MWTSRFRGYYAPEILLSSDSKAIVDNSTVFLTTLTMTPPAARFPTSIHEVLYIDIYESHKSEATYVWYHNQQGISHCSTKTWSFLIIYVRNYQLCAFKISTFNYKQIDMPLWRYKASNEWEDMKCMYPVRQPTPPVTFQSTDDTHGSIRLSTHAG